MTNTPLTAEEKMKTRFTDEEIKAAKSVKAEMLSGNMPNELISIYMAGEICMNQEMHQFASQERERAVRVALETAATHARMRNPATGKDGIFHAQISNDIVYEIDRDSILSLKEEILKRLSSEKPVTDIELDLREEKPTTDL